MCGFPDAEVDLPQIKDIKLYKLLHRYPVTKTYENNQVIINKNKSSESAGEICVAQQSKSTQTSMVTVNQKLFDKEHNKSTEALPEKDLFYGYTYASRAQFASANEKLMTSVLNSNITHAKTSQQMSIISQNNLNIGEVIRKLQFTSIINKGRVFWTKLFHMFHQFHSTKSLNDIF
ncbi:unnamed protein product [Rhizophagus irregularis]|nr:unnamed protein product [Rhizophagus irregularis]